MTRLYKLFLMICMLLGITMIATSSFFIFAQEPTDGQSCNNYKANAHKCSCGRASMCDRQGSPGSAGDPDEYKEGPHKCQMACRKDLCMCHSPCASRGTK